MTPRVKSLLWLRKQYLLSNKLYIYMFLISPLLDIYLIRLILEMSRTQVNSTLEGLVLSFLIFWQALIFLSLLTADEKQTKNLRNLQVMGVTPLEYILSFVLPFIVFTGIGWLAPLILGFRPVSWLYYLLLVPLTTLVYSLLGIFFTLVTRKAYQALVISFVPVILSTAANFWYSNSWIKLLTDYSPLGASMDLLYAGEQFHLLSGSFGMLLVWLVLSLVGTVWLYKANQTREK